MSPLKFHSTTKDKMGPAHAGCCLESKSSGASLGFYP
jgi:hypothetical protein